MRRFLVLGVLLCLVSCIADTSAPSETDDPPEDTAETQDELKVTPFPPSHLPDAEERQRAEVLKKSLTGWRVYIRGQNYVGKSPRDADKMAMLYVMRASDLHDIKKWIVLSLLDAWLDGDRYFEEMVKKHHLTPLDMIGILAALREAGDDPPQLSTLAGRLSTFDEGGGDFPAPRETASIRGRSNEQEGASAGGGLPRRRRSHRGASRPF
jgi:hypothetical protein